MKVTLVNPNRMKPAVSPIALDYLADSLADAGHEVGILDLCFSDDWKSDTDAWFKREQPGLVGMTIRNTDDCYFASQDFFLPFYGEIVSRIKANSDAPVVLGGAGLSVAPDAAIELTGADYAIKGDGEISFPLLASRLEHREEIADIPGLVYRTDDGFAINPPAWVDVSKLPVRSRRWLDSPRYFREGGQAGIETRRGCDSACIYCADPIGKGPTCRFRTPDQIVAEIRNLLDQGIDCYHLCDCEFNLDLKHPEAVCRAIIGAGLGEKIRWYTYASPSPFSDEAAKLMVKAGCAGIDFGADNGDDRMLRTLGRPFNSADLRNTAEICHRNGIPFMYDLLMGGPGETRESVKRTIDLMKEIKPDRVGISVGVRIYGGTALGEMVRRDGLSPNNPALYGRIENNERLLWPVYYIAPEIGLEVVDYITELVGDDPIFLHARREQIEGNYNYNDNSVLVDAIKAGYRGAFWDILRRVHAGIPPVGNGRWSMSDRTD